jgi:hypothetical protein
MFVEYAAYISSGVVCALLGPACFSVYIPKNFLRDVALL